MFFITLAMAHCKRGNENTHHGNDIDTLKVVTLYGPTSFFNYRGEYMGIDYENVRRFAEDEGYVLEIKALNNINELINSLKNREAHLAAYHIPFISEYNQDIIYTGPREVTNQLLVQRKNKDGQIKDVTELIGKEVYVEKNSKYHYRLLNLDEELGGGIDIKTIENDTIVSEDFLEMVNSGKIDYAVVDSSIASIYASAFPNLDLSLPISTDQASFWAVAPGLDSLAVKIDTWENRTHSSEYVKEIYKRYYDQMNSDNFDATLSYFKNKDISKGKPVSSYDNLFKQYASTAGYEWPLLAAIAFCESRFNPTVASRFGAYGLMQVMPATAGAVGIDPGSLGSPEINVKAAARILAKLNQALKNKVDDPEERMKFVVAAYNSGLGHIYDAMALAEKNGMDPQKWTGNVSIAALMKSRPEYYTDPVVKNGYFRGRETVDFVDHVTGIYNYIQSNLKSS